MTQAVLYESAGPATSVLRVGDVADPGVVEAIGPGTEAPRGVVVGGRVTFIHSGAWSERVIADISILARRAQRSPACSRQPQSSATRRS